MAIYILPPSGDLSEAQALAKKAQVQFLSASSLREFIIGTNDLPLGIATLSAEDLMVINRHSKTLLTELPSVVMSCPGALYEPAWMMQAAALPAIDWSEIEKKLAKSGTLATNPEDLAARGRGPLASPTPPQARRAGAMRRDSSQPEMKEDDYDVPDAEGI